MNKIIKNNKYTVIGIIAFVAFISIGYFAYKMFFPNNGEPLYGNRLDGMDKVSITEKQLKEIEEKLEAEEATTKISTNIKGKTVNVVITVKEKTSLDNAKKLTTVLMKEIKEEQKAYYDIQVFINNEKENIDGYPTIGYLGKSEKEFSYSSATYEKE